MKSSGCKSTSTETQTELEDPLMGLAFLPSSRESSFSTQASKTVSKIEEESPAIPSNVSKPEQLTSLPDEFLSGNPHRPLRYVDDRGETSQYSLTPLLHSVLFILLFVELLERFSFYGLYYTQTSFLTGAYDKDWNANLRYTDALSYVSLSTAIAYMSPFFGAIIADKFLGDYRTILLGILVFYIPGLALIALTTIPNLLGKDFNKSAYAIGLLFLWPIGTGIVKSVVNVFGAKQYHPILQSSLIESYYVIFYMCNNIGAFTGIAIMPIVAERNISTACFLPVILLGFGVVFFASAKKTYVHIKPRDEMFIDSNCCFDNVTSGSIGLFTIARITMLVIPFCIAYSQMATTFMVQGTVMKEELFGVIGEPSMNIINALSVLISGYTVSAYLYPVLAKQGIKIPTTYKFAIGSGFGAMAIGWALLVEYRIHYIYQTSGQSITILWQSLSYVLIGIGEIFAVSAAYEVAFMVAPPEKKALASALNLFCVGGIPSMICVGLYSACQPWFQNGRGRSDIAELKHYTEAHVSYYFLLLLAISLFGVFINLIPSMRDWIQSIEKIAAEVYTTPPSSTPQNPSIWSPLVGKKSKFFQRIQQRAEDAYEPLLYTKRQEYSTYGVASQPVYRLGTTMGDLARTGNKNFRDAKDPPRNETYGKNALLFPPSNSKMSTAYTKFPPSIPPRRNEMGFNRDTNSDDLSV